MKPGTRNTTIGARDFARDLGKNQSLGKDRIWQYIRKRQLGFVFKRQVAVGKYVLDFYCPQASLAIEIDGPHHANQRDYNVERDRWLSEQGIGVMRISADDLYYDPLALSQWVRRIQAECELRSRILHPQPPPH